MSWEVGAPGFEPGTFWSQSSALRRRNAHPAPNVARTRTPRTRLPLAARISRDKVDAKVDVRAAVVPCPNLDKGDERQGVSGRRSLAAAHTLPRRNRPRVVPDQAANVRKCPRGALLRDGHVNFPVKLTPLAGQGELAEFRVVTMAAAGRSPASPGPEMGV